jgi:3-methyladenine DNA glycosylase AlkC
MNNPVISFTEYVSLYLLLSESVELDTNQQKVLNSIEKYLFSVLSIDEMENIKKLYVNGKLSDIVNNKGVSDEK